MVERNKWIVLVTELLRATQQGEIQWQRVQTPMVDRPDERIPFRLETTFREQRFRIYEFVKWYPEYEDRGYWDRDTRLEFVDEHGKTIFAVPRVAGLYDLLQAAEYQTAGIDEFMNSLVKSPA